MDMIVCKDSEAVLSFRTTGVQANHVNSLECLCEGGKRNLMQC